MKIRNYLLSITVLLLLVCSASAQKVTGVWRSDSAASTGPKAEVQKRTQPSMYFFTKSHYSIIFVNSDSPRSTDDPKKMTVEQLNNAYVDEFTANAGSYDLKGDVITLHPAVAKSPAYMAGGNWISYKVKAAGNTMTLTEVATKDGPMKEPRILTFTRIE